MDLDMPQALLPRFHALTIGPGLGRATGTGEDGLELVEMAYFGDTMLHTHIHCGPLDQSSMAGCTRQQQMVSTTQIWSLPPDT